MDNKITFKKTLGHFKTICIHKWWVFHYCCKLGIPWRGLVHDNSKFSPVEFWESVRYWDGKSSPIPKCKADIGYSKGWLHHKGRNTHHYEYWIDQLDLGGEPIQIPWKDLLELVADYLGAGRAYSGKSSKNIFKEEAKWFANKIQTEKPKIHPLTRVAIGFLLDRFADHPRYLHHFRRYRDKWRKMYEEGKLLQEMKFNKIS